MEAPRKEISRERPMEKPYSIITISLFAFALLGLLALGILLYNDMGTDLEEHNSFPVSIWNVFFQESICFAIAAFLVIFPFAYICMLVGLFVLLVKARKTNIFPFAWFAVFLWWLPLILFLLDLVYYKSTGRLTISYVMDDIFLRFSIYSLIIMIFHLSLTLPLFRIGGGKWLIIIAGIHFLSLILIGVNPKDPFASKILVFATTTCFVLHLINYRKLYKWNPDDDNGQENSSHVDI